MWLGALLPGEEMSVFKGSLAVPLGLCTELTQAGVTKKGTLHSEP